jgi:hypothetical protein
VTARAAVQCADFKQPRAHHVGHKFTRPVFFIQSRRFLIWITSYLPSKGLSNRHRHTPRPSLVPMRPVGPGAERQYFVENIYRYPITERQ